MDIFAEKLISRKRRGIDYAMAAGIGLAVIFALWLILMFAHLMFGFWFVLIAIVFYGGYRFISNLNVEFEYSLTNDELDIDKIIARRRRKKVISVNARNIEVLAPVSSEKFQREGKSQTISKTYDCSSGDREKNAYFVVFLDNLGQKCLLIFEPTRKMIEGFRKYSPRKVFDV